MMKNICLTGLNKQVAPMELDALCLFISTNRLLLRSIKKEARKVFIRRGVRVAERACLESMCTRKGTVGSNPTLSAK